MAKFAEYRYTAIIIFLSAGGYYFARDLDQLIGSVLIDMYVAYEAERRF